MGKQYVKLIYDNIDFGEEKAKQTHFTKQKLAVHQCDRLQNTSIIQKSQQIVQMPTTDIAEYHIGTKKTPTFHDINEDTQSMLIDKSNGSDEAAHKLDLAYVLTKMVYATDETPLPEWTGFNIMLIDEIRGPMSMSLCK